MKPGDMVRIKRDMGIEIDVYSRWDKSAPILEELGTVSPERLYLVLEMSRGDMNLKGIKISDGDTVGWTYEEFMEVV
ncbi:MAG: hypothetical protein EBU90_19690 [Proteobacteria bacterium]|jgi:hypothetical protein|nr:hypothetical protein [Pseudomonadota bacterium]